MARRLNGQGASGMSLSLKPIKKSVGRAVRRSPRLFKSGSHPRAVVIQQPSIELSIKRLD